MISGWIGVKRKLMPAEELICIYRELAAAADILVFKPPTTHVYNPLVYAWNPVEQYLRLAGDSTKETVFLGMNPGPFGMAQTGVPFGEVSMVRDWMGIEESVGKPENEHPKRPVLGFDCARSEVSGTRLWGWARDRFKTPEAFFSRFFVWNYCPLCFLEDSGRNRTPDKLPAAEKAALFDACDRALKSLVDELKPQWVIGVGKFAEDRAKAALGDTPVQLGRILHPSPASPAANKNWTGAAEAALGRMGIEI